MMRCMDTWCNFWAHGVMLGRMVWCMDTWCCACMHDTMHGHMTSVTHRNLCLPTISRRHGHVNGNTQASSKAHTMHAFTSTAQPLAAGVTCTRGMQVHLHACMHERITHTGRCATLACAMLSRRLCARCSCLKIPPASPTCLVLPTCHRRRQAWEMFDHGFAHYMKHAFPMVSNP
eukprot:364707-Chlamydomonas_euryale.AAC.27